MATAIYMYTRVGQYIDWLYTLSFFTFREANDQLQGAIAQLEQERLTAIKRAQRIQEELKKKTLVRLNETSSSHYHSFVHCVVHVHVDQGFMHDCLLGRGKNQSCVAYVFFGGGAATGNALNLGPIILYVCMYIMYVPVCMCVCNYVYTCICMYSVCM